MEVKPDKVLDVKGLYCPMPAVKTSMQLEKMKSGQVIEVITTDLASRRDLPKWAEETGNKLLKIEIGNEENTTSYIYIQKK